METNNLVKKLVDCGMTKGEADTYLSVLTRPSMTTTEIVKYSGLPRSTIVLALDKLLSLGVIDEYTNGKRRNFVVSSPQAIERYVEDQARMVLANKGRLSALVTDLQKLHFLQKAKNSQVEILKGESGFKELYNRSLGLKKGEEILRLGVEAEKFVFYSDFLKSYVKLKNNKGITTRLILPDSKLGREVAKNENKQQRETRFLAKKSYNPNMMISIWGNNVAFTTWNESLETIVIQSRETVDIIKSVFEILWSISKNNKKI